MARSVSPLRWLAYGQTHKKSVIDFMSKQLKASKVVPGKVRDQLTIKPGFFTTTCNIDPRTLKAISKNFVEQKPLPDEVDLSKYVDTRFLLTVR